MTPRIPCDVVPEPTDDPWLVAIDAALAEDVDLPSEDVEELEDDDVMPVDERHGVARLRVRA